MRCPACGSAATVPAWTGRDRLFRTTDATFPAERCTACRAVFLAPPPAAADLPRYYPDTYWAGPVDPAAGHGLRARLVERYRRTVLRDHVRFLDAVVADERRRGVPVRVLDVGCGDGSVLAALGVASAVGLDQSHGAARATRARGLGAVRGASDAPPFAAASFSLVTLFHVLEHVADPGPPLAAARRLLIDGGDLVVQVPDATCWQAAWLGPRWSGFDVPRHVVNYPADVLPAVLARHGFRVVRTSRVAIRDDTALLASSLVPRLYPPARAARPPGTGALPGWLADLAYLAVTLAIMPLTVVASRRGSGATVMVHAVKSGDGPTPAGDDR